jgi:predicted regulator of Ras-like GTPase activity (Roadblock/LC7/MglB family)
MGVPAREDDPFRRILKDLVTTLPGAWGAVFVDWEGESVELFATSDEYEVKLAGAEVGLLLSRLVASGKAASLGLTVSAMVIANETAFFLHTLDEQYFVLLAADHRVLPGLARARLQSAVAQLRRHV